MLGFVSVCVSLCLSFLLPMACVCRCSLWFAIPHREGSGGNGIFNMPLKELAGERGRELGVCVRV